MDDESAVKRIAILFIDDRLAGQDGFKSASDAVLNLLASAGESAGEACESRSFSVVYQAAVSESRTEIEREMGVALSHARFVLTVGGTGLRPGAYVPEVTEALVDRRLHGVERQVLMQGLRATNKAGLCRGVIGVTNKGRGVSRLIVNSPGSSGGIKDTLTVVLPLLDSIFEQLDGLD